MLEERGERVDVDGPLHHLDQLFEVDRLVQVHTRDDALGQLEQEVEEETRLLQRLRDQGLLAADHARDVLDQQQLRLARQLRQLEQLDEAADEVDIDEVVSPAVGEGDCEDRVGGGVCGEVEVAAVEGVVDHQVHDFERQVQVLGFDGGEVVGEYLLDVGEQQVLGVHEDGQQRLLLEGVEDVARLGVAQRVVADRHVLQQHLVDAEADLVSGSVWREEVGIDVLYYLFLFF